MLSRFNALFPVWAILFSILAYFYPTSFIEFKSLIIPLLSLIMFFMGLTLTAADFKRVLGSPKPIAIGVLLQFLIMPLVAFILAKMLQLPESLAVGLILVGCCAGGTASNVICYLAGANVALSITMTMVSTLAGVFLTPLLAWLYIAQSINVDYLSMFTSILKMVIAPVLIGVLINHYLTGMVKSIEKFLPTMSILFIIFIIAIIVALNKNSLVQIGVLTFIAVTLHNFIGLLSGYTISRALKISVIDSRTIAIEVGMQNSGLAVALALKYFSPAAALPGALFSIWHNVVGSSLASYWRQKSNNIKMSE